ncbi:MAG: aspartate carbamoyltransferase catalytic subunit [Candidatus Margulisiibacteriota bacterium]
MAFPHRHLISLESLSADEIRLILDQSRSIRQLFSRPIKQVPTLRGKHVMLLFFEPSTRTRVSFEMAIQLLGASPVIMNVSGSSVKKGESLYDTLQTLEAMGIDAIVIRHASAGVPDFVSRVVNIPVINAGDGFHEHPTQGLLDIRTMIDARESIEGKHVLILGDIAHSRVARSNIWALTKLGAKVTVCGPPTLIPKAIQEMGVRVAPYLDAVLDQADFINVLRVQFERQEAGLFPSVREYRRFYGLTRERMNKTKPECLVLHPGPVNRGIEIDSDVIDSGRTVILDQVTNGIAVRMAVLYLLLAQGKANGKNRTH